MQTAEALINAGAKLESRMNALGLFPVWSLTFATLGDEAQFVEFLLGKGANVDDVDADGLSALSWAVLTNHLDTLQVLLARGAEVNRVDSFGMTPLLYAASIDFGDTAGLEKLIAAGANVQAKNKQGQTALGLAKAFNHSNAARLLSSKITSKLNTR